jgi:hypothetical protein
MNSLTTDAGPIIDTNHVYDQMVVADAALVATLTTTKVDDTK